jgi:pimeloyl-ACP methyl ester carboxylesterase
VPRTVWILALAAVVLVLASVRDPQQPAPATHYAFGRGPDVVLVHGLGSRIGHWLPAARLLARDHRVTLMELPGHGLAAMPRPFTLEQAADALDRALARVSPDPVVVVGHSLGGLVAAAEALRHPERVRGLVLVETALRPQVDLAELPALLESLDRGYAPLMRAAYMSFGRDSIQGEQLYREVAALDSNMVKRWIRLAWSADLSERIGALRAPLLVVLAPHSWPDREPWHVTAAALGYEQAPRARPVRVADCGHFVMLDQPERLAEIIARFVAFPDGDPVARR